MKIKWGKFPWSWFWFSILFGIWWTQEYPLTLDIRFPLFVLWFWAANPIVGWCLEQIWPKSWK